MRLRWNYNEKNSSKSIYEQILLNRNFADGFFQSDLELPSTNLFKDIEKASTRITEALYNKEKILIFGHDDLDGITSTYILFDFLTSIGSQNHYYYIPNRLIHNHGIQKDLIQFADTNNVDLVITVDGGIKSYDGVEALNSLDIDVIITDHHIVPEKLPNAKAVINPKQDNCDFPYDMLAGVGVTYFLIKHLSKVLNHKIKSSYLLWTAIGSVADKVPLDGLNRILVRNAMDNWLKFEDNNLHYLRNNRNVFYSHFALMNYIHSLIKLLSNGRDLNGKHKAEELLLADNYAKKEYLDELYKESTIFENKIANLKRILNEINISKTNNYLIYTDTDNDIPIELLGMAASFLSSRYKIPIIILRERDENTYISEARCTKGFNLVQSFDYAQSLLKQYGGHAQAAGFTIQKSNLYDFKHIFSEFVSGKLTEINENKKIDIDAVCSIHDLNNINMKKMELLQPFGEANPEPILLIENFSLNNKQLGFSISNIYDLKFDDNKSYKIVAAFRGNYLQILDKKKVSPKE